MEEVKNILRSALNRLDNLPRTSAQTSVISAAPTQTTTSTSGSTTRVEANMRSAFPYFQRRPLSNPRPKKIPRLGSTYTMKETWTHDFFQLALTNANKSPSFHEMTSLMAAGLGKKKVVFPDKNGDFNHIKQVLDKEFPKLKSQNGAFEFLRADRGGASRPLFPIPFPANGYSVSYLKDCIGSGLVYIRPMQSDLSTEPAQSNTPGTSPVVTNCVNCHLAIPICEIRQHVQTCAGGSSKSCDDNGNDSNDSDLEVGIFTEKETTKKGVDSPTPSVTPECKRKSFDDLKQIFPSHDVEYLNEVLDSSNNIDEAVANVLDEEILAIPDRSFASENVTDPLHNYRKQVKSDKQYIYFNRMQLSTLRQLMSLFKDPKFDMRKEPDVCFVGEMGRDLGGPKREFFSLAIHSLTKVDKLYNLQLFGGKEGHLIPLYGVDALSEGCFEMAGKLIAYSVLHSSDGFIGMSPAVVEYLCTGSLSKASSKVTIEDLYDVELRQIIDKVIGKEGLELTEEEKDKIEEKMVSHGLTDIPLTEINKEKAVKDLMIAEVVITRVLAMEAIYKGLNSLGLGKLLRSYPTLIAPKIFPSIEEVEIDPKIVKQKFHRGVQDCNNEKKEKAKAHFLSFIEESANLIDELTGKPMIYSLVKFVKGSCHIQADEEFVLAFNEDEAKILLEADSCFSKIILPLAHSSYEDFKIASIKSLHFGGVGYGKF